jgi:hypothetical protein
MAVALHVSLLFVFDEKLTRLAWMGIVLCGAMLVLSVYTITAYFVETFSVDGTTMLIRSVTQSHRFGAASLKELVWNCKWRGGKLTFRTTTSKSVLHLFGFAPADRLEIVRIVRRLVPKDAQIGWDEFCHFVALPLREGKRSRQPGVAHIDPATLPESERVHVTRSRIDRFFVALLLINAILAVALWQIWAIPKALALPALVLLLWGLLRWCIPATGTWSVKWSAIQETKYLVIALFIMPPTFVVGLIFTAMGWNGMVALYIGLALMVGLTANGLRHAYRRAKDQRARDTADVPNSLKRWNT